MEATARNRELWQRARAHAASLGIALEQAAVGGASDGNTTSLHTATLDGLGAVGDGAHAHHEHVLLDAMAERAALLALLVARPGRSHEGRPMRLVRTSVARLLPPDDGSMEPVAVPRERWRTGDYVVGEVVGLDGRPGRSRA